VHPSANQSAKRLRKTKELCENQAGAHTKNKDANKPWWEILEVPQCAPKEVIQKAFREKILRYHPDRLESLGEEFKNWRRKKQRN
jgi:preprotein translocase subunit Sec63